MPRYTYECLDCKEVFTIFHSISEKPDSCISCPSTSLQKLLSKPYFKTDKQDMRSSQPGELVNSSIEEFREDLKQQKQGLLDQAKESPK